MRTAITLLLALLLSSSALAADVTSEHTPIEPSTAADVQPLVILPHTWVAALAFSEDGSTLTTLDGALVLRDWNVVTGEMLRQIELATIEPNFRRAAFSPDGTLVAASLSEHAVGIWRQSDGFGVATLPGDTFVMGLSFSSDSSLLAVGRFNGVVELWKVDTGELLSAWSAHPSAVHALAFSPDMTLFASGSINATWTLRLWETADWSLKYERTVHREDVYRIAFVPDGRQFLSASGDRTVILWDTASGNPIRTYAGHWDIVNDLALSPSGAVLATAASDRLVRLWEFATATLLATLRGHSSYVFPIAFSPTGTRVASGTLSRLGQVIIWGVP